ncbi:hypothetical protein AF72_03640 [Xylella taiwanensis]|uniref:Uncharacterized protein n=1 Tax=Xylella taiwanensis TaxID=1444770 RepID=Z9JL13_9GAMM|nr:hypothetical protein AF72_03640 [Xylella taiwanensis]
MSPWIRLQVQLTLQQAIPPTPPDHQTQPINSTRPFCTDTDTDTDTDTT